jgi:adenylate kinase
MAGGLIFFYTMLVFQEVEMELLLQREGAKVDVSLLIYVRDEELISRLGGRWICRNCGRLYHERNDPPKTAGVCDACGGELYQRDDDKPEVVGARLEKQKPPAGLIEHYRKAGVLKEIDGEQPLDTVTALLLEAIR